MLTKLTFTKRLLQQHIANWIYLMHMQYVQIRIFQLIFKFMHAWNSSVNAYMYTSACCLISYFVQSCITLLICAHVQCTCTYTVDNDNL